MVVFDSVQLIKNKLKETRKPEDEVTLVDDDTKGLEQLDMVYTIYKV